MSKESKNHYQQQQGTNVMHSFAEANWDGRVPIGDSKIAALGLCWFDSQIARGDGIYVGFPSMH